LGHCDLCDLCGLFGHKDHEGDTKNTKQVCDDLACLLFINGTSKKSVSQNNGNNNYFVSVMNGKIDEELLPLEIIK
jgi:hypothetical protein